MILNESEYPDGIDLVWLCIDKFGFIGAFVTAGIGPIPKIALASQVLPLLEIESLVLELKEVSEVEMIVDLPRPDDFIALAKRGIYVYDWSDVDKNFEDSTKSYEIMAVPSHPKSVNDLIDLRLKEYLHYLKIKDVTFKENQFIDINEEFDCINKEI